MLLILFHRFSVFAVPCGIKLAVSQLFGTRYQLIDSYSNATLTLWLANALPIDSCLASAGVAAGP